MHQKRIMAGIFAIKKNCFKEKMQDLYKNWTNMNLSYLGKYGVDENFLENKIYEKVKDNCLIHIGENT